MQGWDNEDGDAHFQWQKQTADRSTYNKKNQKYFFGLIRRIGAELHYLPKRFQLKAMILA